MIFSFVFSPYCKFFSPLAVTLFLTLACSFTLSAQKGNTGDTDSTGIALRDTTGKKRIIKDSLIILRTQPFYQGSLFTDIESQRYNPYRNISDIFERLPFIYRRSLGFPASWENFSGYGEAAGTTIIMRDGVNFSELFSGSTNPNYYNTELFDSIEFVPSTRAFLYGGGNASSVINLISNERIPPAPYTRIRYYEGTYEEGLIEASFSTQVMRRMYTTIGLKNHNFPGSYRRSAGSAWSGQIGLQWYLQNNLQLFAGYDFANSLNDLNGGVNTDTLKKLGVSINEYLYDEFGAPVYFEDRYQKHKQSSFSGELRATWFPGFSSLTYTTASLLREYRQNENGEDSSLTTEIIDFGSTLHNILFKHKFSNYPARLIYQYRLNKRTEGPAMHNVVPEHSLSVALPLTPANTATSTEIFGRWLVNNGVHFWGGGIDIRTVGEKQDYYLGASMYRRVPVYSSTERSYAAIVEAAVNTSLFGVYTSLRGYAKAVVQDSYNEAVTHDVRQYAGDAAGYDPISKAAHFGISLSAAWNHSFFFTEGKIETIKSSAFFSDYSLVPPLRGMIDFSYRNTHFDSSLVLRAGVQLFASSSVGFYRYNAILPLYQIVPYSPDIPGWFRADVYASGEIKRSAIVFLTIENIFDSGYYITPYYPMPGISFRFGINWQLFN